MNTQCKKEEQTDSGKIAISNFKIEQQKTFMDYMQEGLEIKFAVAIDFTGKNKIFVHSLNSEMITNN